MLLLIRGQLLMPRQYSIGWQACFIALHSTLRALQSHTTSNDTRLTAVMFPHHILLCTRRTCCCACHAGLLSAGFAQAVRHAVSNFTAPNAIIIPQRVQAWLQVRPWTRPAAILFLLIAEAPQQPDTRGIR
jgi:hypothetical protein